MNTRLTDRKSALASWRLRARSVRGGLALHSKKATAARAELVEASSLRAGYQLGPVSKQRIAPISYFRALVGGSSRDEERFYVSIRERFGSGSYAVAIGRARSGIYLLSKCALESGRRKVLMSPFTIPDVATMVRLAGGEPVFFDFEPGSTACDLNVLDKLLDADTACVLVTHQHVNEKHLPEIAVLCRSRGAYLFDDCALAFGGTIHGRPIGTLTDASVFSLSSFKALNYFWGGLITTRHQSIADYVNNEVARWPRLGVRYYLSPAKTCLRFDIATSPALFRNIVYPILRRRACGRREDLNSLSLRHETMTLTASLTSRPALSAYAEWNRKLPGIEACLRRRRAIAEIYRAKLGQYAVSADSPPWLLDGSCFVNYALLAPTGRRDELRRNLMAEGFDVGRNLYPNIHRHPRFEGASGISDNVDMLTAATLYLPTHFGVSVAYAEALATRVAKLYC